MKILMFGRGAIATLYGWAFTRAGHQVEYFVRPGRAAEYGSVLQVDILDCRYKRRGERVSENLQTSLREDLPKNHDFDLIIVSVQHYNFNSVAQYLASRVSNATVLVFNNFWDEPFEAASPLPLSQLTWGFPGAGGGFPGKGMRGVLLKKVNFGTLGPGQDNRKLMVRNLFRKTGFDIVEHEDFRGWLLIHFILNGGLHAESMNAGSHVRLYQSVSHCRNAIRIMRELLCLLRERDVDFSAHRADLILIKLPGWIGGSVLALAWKFYRPLRRIVESHSMPNDPLQTVRDLVEYAKVRGIATPLLDNAYASSVRQDR